MSALARPAWRRSAFTLVELLVVIGIIAILVAILLPALTAARRQADAVKCAAQLREIGNAFQMYAIESKGWYPPAQLQTNTGVNYNIDGIDYPAQAAGSYAYWYQFLGKFLAKGKLGTAAGTQQEAIDQRKTVFWGCPAWYGYTSTAIGGTNRTQTGYGMNPWPTFSATNPAIGTNTPPTKERSFIQNWPGTPTAQIGNFFRQKAYATNGAERCLVSDSLFWEVESQRSNSGVMLGQAMLTNTTAAGNHAFALGNTLADCYRHGKYPEAQTTFNFKPQGGKIAWNMLYGDNHVATSTIRDEAWRALRMRDFPN